MLVGLLQPSDLLGVLGMSSKSPFASDGHSGAVPQQRYLRHYFFNSGSGSAAAFFRHQRQAAAPLFF